MTDGFKLSDNFQGKNEPVPGRSGKASSTVLIVEDDTTLRETLAYNLDKENYVVLAATSGEEGLRLALEEKPDVVILDIMLPGMNGLEVCRLLREKSSVPILILTAKKEETDKLVGLELGADDYVTKPFSMKELMARIRAMLRRQQTRKKVAAEEKYITAGNIKIDAESHRVLFTGSPLDLSPKEFELLKFLVKNKGRVFGRNVLLDTIWGKNHICDQRTVDVHIWNLRQKIEANPRHPTHIVTVRRAGYKFVASPDA